MSEQGVTYQQATVAEAAVILGVSVMTVRRMIKRGQLEGERVLRPQGSAYLVKIPVQGTDETEDAPPTEQPAENVSRTNGTPSELMAVWSETFLGPIMTRMAEQEATIREQAETIGELRAENRALVARTEAQPVEPTTESPIPLSRRLTRWLVLGLVLVGVLSTVVALLAWPR